MLEYDSLRIDSIFYFHPTGDHRWNNIACDDLAAHLFHSNAADMHTDSNNNHT